MFTTVAPRMGKRKKAESTPQDEPGGETRHVRVFDDLAEMIAWICRVENTTTAKLLDPIIRGSVVARYAQIEDVVAALKRAEQKAREAGRKGPKG